MVQASQGFEKLPDELREVTSELTTSVHEFDLDEAVQAFMAAPPTLTRLPEPLAFLGYEPQSPAFPAFNPPEPDTFDFPEELQKAADAAPAVIPKPVKGKKSKGLKLKRPGKKKNKDKDDRSEEEPHGEMSPPGEQEPTAHEETPGEPLGDTAGGPEAPDAPADTRDAPPYTSEDTPHGASSGISLEKEDLVPPSKPTSDLPSYTEATSEAKASVESQNEEEPLSIPPASILLTKSPLPASEQPVTPSME